MAEVTSSSLVGSTSKMSATRSKTDAVSWPVFDPAPYDLEPGPFYS